MKFLFDFFPILLFFLVYKFYGDLPVEIIGIANAVFYLSLIPGNANDAIFLATAIAIIATFFQLMIFWLKHRRFEKIHIISLVLITVFGGATLLLQDPIYIKWKPTILNWLFALVFLGSQYIGKRPLAQRMMQHAITVPALIWQRVNMAWVAFFGLAGTANIYVAYTFSEDTWVDFKLFGLMGLTLIFGFAQALYLTRYVVTEEKQPDGEA